MTESDSIDIITACSIGQDRWKQRRAAVPVLDNKQETQSLLQYTSDVCQLGFLQSSWGNGEVEIAPFVMHVYLNNCNVQNNGLFDSNRLLCDDGS